LAAIPAVARRCQPELRLPPHAVRGFPTSDFLSITAAPTIGANDRMPPWNKRREIGYFTAIARTMWQCLFKPSAFFSELSSDFPLMEAFSFYIAVFVICPLLFAVVLLLAFAAFFLISFGGASSMALLPALLPVLIGEGVVYVISIVLMTGITFLMAGFLHLFVLAFSGKGGFKGTFSVYVYSAAATCLYGLMAAPPLFFSLYFASKLAHGPPVVAIGIVLFSACWLMVVPILGYRSVHQMGSLRAAASYLIPILLILLVNIWLGRASWATAKNVLTTTPFPIKALPFLSAGELAADNNGAADDLSDSSGIRWHSNLRTALKLAAAEDTPIMIDFFTEWCGWCKKLDTDTYSDPTVRELSERFICVKIDGDKEPALVAKYSVSGYPTILFLASSGDNVDTVVGYADPRHLSEKMNAVLKQTAGPSGGRTGSGKTPSDGTTGFRLGGILLKEGNTCAIINNSIVRIGDTIQGAQVVDIQRHQVKLLQKHKAIVLTIGDNQAQPGPPK
jgi:thiol-disulfide isomerase/thioredoxin